RGNASCSRHSSASYTSALSRRSRPHPLARRHVRWYVHADRLQAFQARFETAFQLVQAGIEGPVDRIQLAVQLALLLHHGLFELAGDDGLALAVLPQMRIKLLAQVGETGGLGLF